MQGGTRDYFFFGALTNDNAGINSWMITTENQLQHNEIQRVQKITRKLSYRKDDRAMRPMYGCPENVRDSLTTPTATFPDIFNGPYECTGQV